MDDFISREVRRTNRNLFLVNAFIVLGLASVVALQWKYCANFAMGTAPISNQELSRITSPEQRFRTFVRVQAEEVFYSGVHDVEREIDKYSRKVVSEKAKANYLVVIVNQRPMVVKASLSSGGKEFKGQIVMLPSDVRSAILEDARETDASSVPALMPIMLDAVEYRHEGYWGLAVGLPLLGLAVWNLNKWWLRTRNPRTHPLNALIRRCGDPLNVTNEINNEVRSGSTKFGSVLVSANWIIHRAFFTTTAMKFEHVVWSYPKITKHYTYFVPTGKSFAAIVCGRFGNSFEASMKEKKCTEFLALIAERTPFAVAGFSNELKSLWQKNAKQFVALVDQRRKEATMPPAPKIAEQAVGAKA
jgi:Family of unknown function (DUF6709)